MCSFHGIKGKYGDTEVGKEWFTKFQTRTQVRRKMKAHGNRKYDTGGNGGEVRNRT